MRAIPGCFFVWQEPIINKGVTNPLRQQKVRYCWLTAVWEWESQMQLRPLQFLSKARGMLAPGLMALVAAGFWISPALFSGRSNAEQAGLIGGWQMEPDSRSEECMLQYHGRGLELQINRLGRVALEAEAEGSASEGKRILLEELTVTLDLSREQWPSVFESWFRQSTGLSEGIALHGAQVVIAGRAAWEYTCAAAEAQGGSGSRFWRVYLFPCGRSAYVVRSEGWGIEDAMRYGSALDRVAAGLKSGR